MLRLALAFGLTLTALALGSHLGWASSELVKLENSGEFFPDIVGSRWTYQGEVVTTPLQRVRITKRFRNVSTVTGKKSVQGVEVIVFHDTNPGDHGPSDSFYRRDAAGIVYYGSDPGTILEKQVVPYQVVTFPLTFPSSFEQFDRKGLDFGRDLDGDGTNETTDLAATVSLVGLEEVSVTAGTYEAIRVEARMTIRIHLTKSGRVAVGDDHMTAWFSRGIGLIKYTERQHLPGIRTDEGQITVITEELEELDLKSQSASLEGSESSSEGILTDDSRLHELGEVLVPAGLRPNP